MCHCGWRNVATQNTRHKNSFDMESCFQLKRQYAILHKKKTIGKNKLNTFVLEQWGSCFLTLTLTQIRDSYATLNM